MGFTDFLFGEDPMMGPDPLTAEQINQPFQGMSAPNYVDTAGEMAGIQNMLMSMFGDRRAAMTREATKAGADTRRQMGSQLSGAGLGRGAMASGLEASRAQDFTNRLNAMAAIDDTIASALPSFVANMNTARGQGFRDQLGLAQQLQQGLLASHDMQMAQAQMFNENRGGGLMGSLGGIAQLISAIKGFPGLGPAETEGT